MRRLFERMADLLADDGFLRFQTEVVRNCYEALGSGYSSGDNEVGLVKRLVDAVNDRSYRSWVHLSGSMLHGSRSYVEFNYQDKPVTKELADMAVISMVTEGGSPLLSRICLIQNKKDHSSNWAIDREQLFLLKNFPVFAGNKGIFRGPGDVQFRNGTGCLGAFGLLESPGEMILASAPLVSELLRGKQSLTPSDVCVLGQGAMGAAHGEGVSSLWPMVGVHPHEWRILFSEFANRFGYPFWLCNGPLGNLRFTRDLYDFIRGWTHISIGEPTRMYGNVTNPVVDGFSNYLLRNAKLSEHIDLPVDNYFGDSSFHGQMGVLLMHIDLG